MDVSTKTHDFPIPESRESARLLALSPHTYIHLDVDNFGLLTHTARIEADVELIAQTSDDD